MITYKITDQDKFDKNVNSLSLNNLFAQYGGSFTGSITIETQDSDDITSTGQHGANDYQQEYGFILIVEDNE